MESKASSDPDPERRLPFKEEIYIPIRMVDNLIIVHAEMEDMKGNFILDLGAENLVLNEVYFRDLKGGQESHSANVNNELEVNTSIWLKKLDVSGLEFSSVRAFRSDLSHIENSKGIKILGLLGVSVFSGLKVTIDLRSQYLLLENTEKGDDPPKSDLQWSIELRSNVVLMSARVAEDALRFCFDTGAEWNVLDRELPSEILNHLNITGVILLQGTGGGTSRAISGNLDHLWIAERDFPNLNTLVTSLQALEENYGVEIDGIIGYPLMEQGILSLDLRNEYMTLNLYDRP
jgi:hypothetical protein